MKPPRIQLVKSWTNVFGRKYPVGQILQGTKEFVNELISSGTAKEYKGVYPPRTKVKSDFFKPK